MDTSTKGYFMPIYCRQYVAYNYLIMESRDFGYLVTASFGPPWLQRS